MFGHPPEPPLNKKQIHRKLQISTHCGAYGQLSSLAPVVTDTTTQLHLRLNCKRRSSQAIARGFIIAPTHQVLPQEDIAIIIWGNKITNDISHPIWFHASKEIARELLTDTRKWPKELFEEVD
jgi:hypothetical protein